MKYLVLRKRARTFEDPFVEPVAAIAREKEFDLPFEVTTRDLSHADASDLCRDPKIAEVVLSIPFTLIAPVGLARGRRSDPAATTVWGLDAVGALDTHRNGEGVTVAVLDTGIDTQHPAFSGRKFAPADLMDFTKDEQGVAGAAPDKHGHGTHVAGTIFGGEVGGTRIGVAPGVSKALIGKILGPKGASSEVVLNGIEWALKNGADVISMSLGIDFAGLVAELEADGLPPEIAASRALEAYRSTVRLFDRLAALVEARVARGRGALLVAAAGNESQRSQNPQFTVAVAPPAAADGFISVGALGKTNIPATPFFAASFSNTGCRVSAPGVSILSAELGGELVAHDGTSMATPHVAGVAALWIQELFPDGGRPPGWAKDVQSAVENKVAKIPGQTRNDVGLGIVRAPGGKGEGLPGPRRKQERPKSGARQARKGPRAGAK